MTAGPVSLSSYIVQQQGPGPLKIPRQMLCLSPESGELEKTASPSEGGRSKSMSTIATGRPGLFLVFSSPLRRQRKKPGRLKSRSVLKLVLLFASLLAIPLARQSCLDATLLTGLQVVGVTLDFLDDVLLLYLPLKPAQRIFERLALLNANLCQKIPPPNPPNGLIS